MNRLLENALDDARQAEILLELLRDCREFLSAIDSEKSRDLQDRIKYAIVRHL